MRFIFAPLVFLFFCIVSCHSDLDFVASNGSLKFSKDTIYLDTVFTGVKSSTYRLKIYNQSKNNITIPSISLKNGVNSKYRLMVDGSLGEKNLGKSFKNIEILAKDSLTVFIEHNATVNDVTLSNLLYTDKILFDAGKHLQTIELVSLIKDAYFLYPKKPSTLLLTDDSDPESGVYGFELNENDPVNGNELHFTNKKAYVIYGFAGVPKNKTLTIDAGARIFFHDNSGIYVKKEGTLIVNGTLTNNSVKNENQVVFEGDRQEPEFKNTPGQWHGIILDKESRNNLFTNVLIKNSTNGLTINTDKTNSTIIKNMQIYNCSGYGILARNTKIYGENIAINHCGQASFAGFSGGDYTFNNCSFINFWNSSPRQMPSVYLENIKNTGKGIMYDLENATFVNCIIYGSNAVEVGLRKEINGGTFNYNFSNCLIKFNDFNNQYTTTLYDFITKAAVYKNIISSNKNLNDPKFKDVLKNDLRILNQSAAIGKGDTNYLITKDILGIIRTTPPDLGAYQHNN